MSNILFGQLVIGSPGAGKTTYCEAMARFLKANGCNVAIVNIELAKKMKIVVRDLKKFRYILNAPCL